MLLGILLLLLRLALPVIVAPIIAERLSHLLETRVEVGDVTFQPIDAIFTLSGVTVHGPRPAGSAHGAPPPIVADRVRVDVQWLPLMHRTLRVRELSLESASIAVDRLPDGEFALAGLKPAKPERELPPGWEFALDRIVVRDSRLQLRDLATADSEPLEVRLRDAEVSGLRQRATAFGRVANLHVDAFVGRGRLRVQGRYDLRDDGLSLNLLLRVKDVPLDQAMAYLPELGWSGISGHVHGQLRWQREPQRRDLLSGRVTLRRGQVHTPGLDEPALSIRRAELDVDAIDLRQRKISLGSLVLHGPTLAVRPDADAPLPLIAHLPPRPRSARGTALRRSADEVRWGWIIERFDTMFGRVAVFAPAGRIDLRARTWGENLGPGAYWSPVRFQVSGGEAAAAFDGTARLADGVTIEGRFVAGGIDFPAFAQAVDLPWAPFARSGQAAADLNVQFQPGETQPWDVRGPITLADVRFVGPGSTRFVVAATSAELTLAGISLRDEARDPGRATRIRFDDAVVSEPTATLTRTLDGWFLPPFTSPAAEEGDATAGSGAGPTGDHAGIGGTAARAGAARLPDAAPTPEVPVGPPPPELLFARARTSGGKLTVDDLVPIPAVVWGVTGIEGSVRALRLPDFGFEDLSLRGSDPRFGELRLAGRRGANATRLEAGGDGIPLVTTGPYLGLAALPYRFTSGTGSFIAQVSIGESRWTADTTLTLHEPRLGGSEVELERAIGMPVSSALALLRDQNGDVVLRVPLTAPTEDAPDVVAGRVAMGVREAIRRTTESPPQQPAGFAPVEISFLPGRSELSDRAAAQIAAIGATLASRPGLIVELTAAVSPEDRRWLAEQALAEDLAGGGGFMGVLRALGVRDSRVRIRAALAERAEGKPGPLDAEDARELDLLLADRPPPSAAQLAGLRDARLERVANQLTDRNGIERQRVEFGRAPGGRVQGTSAPAVLAQVKVGAVTAAPLEGSSLP